MRGRMNLVPAGLIVVTLTWVTPVLIAQSPSSAPAEQSTAEKAVDKTKAAGASTAKAGKAAAEATEKGAKKAASATAEGTKTAAKATESGAKATAEGTKKAAGATAEGAKSVGKKVTGKSEPDDKDKGTQPPPKKPGGDK